MDGLAGCVAAGQVKRGARVLFIHCGGGPSLFPFAKQLGA
jgi:1-aminocyclopropane-1-carboxylate deaminase/D-cysteine desulfhydrase-like pyridoxal-dependent ACC family enzyme